MKTLDELWYGNISPFEQCTRGDKWLKELLKLVARNRQELDGTLTEKQKETLEKFEECMNEMHSITERDAFSYGFRLGVQLMAESFLQPMGEDEMGYPYLDGKKRFCRAAVNLSFNRAIKVYESFGN